MHGTTVKIRKEKGEKERKEKKKEFLKFEFQCQL
jgi:hypothetical protein